MIALVTFAALISVFPPCKKQEGNTNLIHIQIMKETTEEVNEVVVSVKPTNPKFRDLEGQKFGRWLVLSYAGKINKHKSMWNCVCECGTPRVIFLTGLVSSHTLSCGCLKRDLAGTQKITHGAARGIKTKEYRTYGGIKRRCTVRTNPAYPSYGGRGITVCRRWLDGFENFLEDMGYAPSPSHSIDRIDNNGGYSKENCRWATSMEQGSNKRNNINLTFNGKTQTLAQWARELGINEHTLYGRLFASGWSVEASLTQEVTTPKTITFNGITKVISDWAKMSEIPSTVISDRIFNRGWTVEEALTTPITKARELDSSPTYNGKTQTVKEWAVELGMNVNTLRNRLFTYGWATERALSTPARKPSLIT